MKLRFGLALLTAGLVVPAMAAAEETLDTVEKKINEEWAKLKSMTAKMTMDMNAMGVTIKMEGTVEYLKKDDKELFRSDLKIEQTMGPNKMEGTSMSIFDGEHLYGMQDMMGRKMARKQNAEQMQGSPGGQALFKDLKKKHELTLLPDEKLDGKDVFVIEGVPKDPSQARFQAKVRAYFLKTNGIMVKMTGLNEAGEATMTMTFGDIKLDPKVDPDRFVFKAPEGVEVVDMTGG